MKELFLSNRIMIFKHISTGNLIETHNMFYLMFKNAFEFMGCKSETGSEPEGK
jgi:hypothetical protein